MFLPGITSLLVVTLVAHSQAQISPGWLGCQAIFTGAGCTGVSYFCDCAQVNSGCIEDTTGSDASTWDKYVSSSATCVNGAWS